MPPAHRALISHLEQTACTRAMVARSPDARLRTAYNDAVCALQDFRIRHLEYAARYIARFATADAKGAADVGTGGTPFMRYLAQHRDATEAHLL
jgi:indoleamine 2,3-dioxygenase